MTNVFIFILGLLFGGGAVWYILTVKTASAIEETKNAILETNARQGQRERDSFLAIASERFAPFVNHFQKLESLIQQLDSKQSRASGEFDSIAKTLIEESHYARESTNALQKETSILTTSLKNPTVRGRWGEIQLRRIIELAGMLEWCDFGQQTTLLDSEGRPDLRVNLPGNEHVYVDAKAPLNAYLALIEEKDPEKQKDLLNDHVKAVKSHIDTLVKRGYHKEAGSIGFTIMYIPGEAFLQAALEGKPDLLEYATERDIYLCGPLTLMPILKSYALGWRERRQEEQAHEIAVASGELYNRLLTFIRPFQKIGESLTKTITEYNSAVGSFEGRLLPQAKRMKELAAIDQIDCPEPKHLDENVRLPVDFSTENEKLNNFILNLNKE